MIFVLLPALFAPSPPRPDPPALPSRWACVADCDVYCSECELECREACDESCVEGDCDRLCARACTERCLACVPFCTSRLRCPFDGTRN
jgi:hypothetical protein